MNSKIFKESCNFLIIGKRSSGKSCLGFVLLENISKFGNKQAYFYRCPNPSCLKKLPFEVRNALTLKELNNLVDAVVLIDDAHMSFDVLNKKENQKLKSLLSSSRQNNVSFIFITHNSYFITRGLFSYIDVRIIKEVSEGHWEVERAHMRKLYEMISIMGRNKFFIDSDFYRGEERFDKPDWFTEEFSTMFKNRRADISFFEKVRPSPPLPATLRQNPEQTVKGSEKL